MSDAVFRTTQDRYLRFVESYMVFLDATRAAIAAGYSSKTAGAKGSKLLSRPQIKQMIAERQAALAEQFQISAERVLQEYAAIAFADIGDVVEDDGSPMPLRSLKRQQRAAIAEVSSSKEGRRLRLHDKRAALADLAKHLGLFERDNRQRAASMNLALQVVLHGQPDTAIDQDRFTAEIAIPARPAPL